LASPLVAVGTALMVIFATTLVWWCSYQAVDAILNVAEDWVQGNSMASAVLSITRNVWYWFPVIIIFAVIFWMIIYMQRREAESYVQPI